MNNWIKLSRYWIREESITMVFFDVEYGCDIVRLLVNGGKGWQEFNGKDAVILKDRLSLPLENPFKDPTPSKKDCVS